MKNVYLRTIALFMSVLCAASLFAAQSAQPNIIFILTDDQRYDAAGFLNPMLETPHIDSLASEGVHFSRAFVTTSLCSPSRASILSGLYMRNHRVVDNNRVMDPSIDLFPQLLQQAGYTTAFIGKWHMGEDSDATRRGFDHWVSFKGQGTYAPKNILGEPGYLNINGEKVARKGYITDELTDYAVDWLEQRDEEKPFFLYLSHKAVHAGFDPAERHQDQYADVTFSLPESLPYPPQTPRWVQDQRNSWHGVEFPFHGRTPVEVGMKRYYKALSAVDDSLGRLRQLLDEKNLADNTLVVFMSDNGFLLGEHGLIDKRNAYEESMRTFLVAAGPGLMDNNAVVDDLVANIDIAPTLLEVAGIEPKNAMDGRSFLSLATGQEPEPAWREEIDYEYFWEYNFPHSPTTFALRGKRYKYVQYHGVWDLEQLFDLQSDPQEMHNLIHQPEHLERIVAMRHRLYEIQTNSRDENEIPYNVRQSEGSVLRHQSAPQAAPFPPSWLRGDHPADKYYGLIPDGPQKQQTIEGLKKIHAASIENK
jgi:N-acetylglucosamine-6-sulfatase